MSVLTGCASLSTDDRVELDAMAQSTVDKLSRRDPQLLEKIEASVGYLVVDRKILKIPFFGGGKGKGVLIENATDRRTYVSVSRMEVGGGGGIRRFKALILYSDPALFNKARSGQWLFQAGTDMSAGESSADPGKNRKTDGYELYLLPEEGAAVIWSLRAIRVRPLGGD